jgi:hypothetical protein
MAYHLQETVITPSPGWTPTRKTKRPNQQNIRVPGPRQHRRRGRQSHQRIDIYQGSATTNSFRLSVKSHGSAPSQNSCEPYQTPTAETSMSRNSSASYKPHTRTKCRQVCRVEPWVHVRRQLQQTGVCVAC